MTRRIFLWAVMLFLVIGCGSENADTFTSSQSSQVQSTQAAPGEQIFGKIEVAPVMFVLNEETRETILPLREQLAQQGYLMGEKGEFIVYPTSQGSAWQVSISGQAIVAAPDGSFSLTVPSNPDELGFLQHPDDERLNNTPFPLSALSQDPKNPGTIIVPMAFRGGCGMSEDDFCGPEAQPRYIPPDLDPGSQTDFKFWGVTRKPLGTYPPDDSYIEGVPKLACPDFDGPLADDNKAREDHEYPGSTCDLNVLDGACPNENPLSDQEYLVFVEQLGLVNPLEDPDVALKLSVKSLFVDQRSPSAISLAMYHIARVGPKRDDAILLTPPALAGVEDIQCLKNHKGRVCGMFLAGDVAVQLTSGEIVLAGAGKTIKVSPGASGSFTLHNNGVFGVTHVRSEAGPVSLSNSFLQGDSFNRKLLHYEPDPDSPVPSKKFAYIPDQTVNFEVAATAEKGEQQAFTFAVDDKQLTLVFEVQGKVQITPSEVVLREDETATFTVEIPEEFKPTATYQWDLTNDTGTLTSLTTPSVTYSVSDSVQAPAKDTVTVEVAVKGELLGTASASITISNVDISITPSSASLEPGESETFSALAVGIPLGETAVYEWESVSGLGTLSPAAGQNVTYTVLENLTPPQNDILRLRVYSEDGQGSRTLQGIEDVSISIEEGLNAGPPFVINDLAPPSLNASAFLQGKLITLWLHFRQDLPIQNFDARLSVTNLSASPPQVSNSTLVASDARIPNIVFLTNGSGCLSVNPTINSGQVFPVDLNGTLGTASVSSLPILNLASNSSEVFVSTLEYNGPMNTTTRAFHRYDPVNGLSAPFASHTWSDFTINGVVAETTNSMSANELSLAHVGLRHTGVQSSNIMGGIVSLTSNSLSEFDMGPGSDPDIALSPSGGGLVAFRRGGAEADSVVVRTFSETGVLGAELELTGSGLWNISPKVAVDPTNGEYVVVWFNGNLVQISPGFSQLIGDVVHQRLGSNGSPVSGLTVVAPNAIPDDVSMDSLGNYVITYKEDSILYGRLITKTP